MKKFVITAICLTAFALTLTMLSNRTIRIANTSVSDNFPQIIIDAGHGGFDGGAVCGEIIEKDINLSFALSAETLFKAFGYEVIMTRTTDNGTQDSGLNTIRSKKVSDIKNRLGLIENNEIELFLSFHQNKFSQSIYSGTQVFYGPKNELSARKAESIQKSVRNMLQTENNRVEKPCGKNIYLMYHSSKPSVLVECGFMSNADELKKLLDKEYQIKLNFCILTGVLKRSVK